MSSFQIFWEILVRLTPVWIALVAVFAISYPLRNRLGLYGRLYDSPIGMVGLNMVLFWVFVAIFADMLAVIGPAEQVVSLRKSLPGTESDGLLFLLGGDQGGRDVFSRLAYGARLVLPIAATATLLAFIVGIVTGLPAGYFAGRIDGFLSFVANAVLSFPVILLFYLIVLLGRGTGIVETLVGVLGFAPVFFFTAMGFALYGRLGRNSILVATALLPFAIILSFMLAAKTVDAETGLASFAFPMLPGAIQMAASWLVMLAWAVYFGWCLMNSRSKAVSVYAAIVVPVLGFIYARIAFSAPDLSGLAAGIAPLIGGGSVELTNRTQTFISTLFIPQDAALNVFVAVCFASAPGVFRLVRGLTMDVKARDYVAAAETRGENTWYIMIFEILPNIRGPLIVDAALRIGYTTILLGVLGFLGLGLGSESADWGAMINSGRQVMRIYPHMVLPPAIALASLVLGLNLLADGLREMSLKD